jgi:hypothetical protein
MALCMNCGSEKEYNEPRHHIICNDGTTLSVQVGSSLYCTPRDNKGPWTHVEVGYPTAIPPDTWLEYADSDGINSDVFGYVPVELVETYIASHGGRKIWV